MDNLLIIAIVAVILAAAAWYIYRQKKSAAKCIGCPDSRTCAGNCQGCAGCGCSKENA